ncbi:MAG TPA: M56 family metallopeptidase [Rhizomicrobium sp.]|nr:M56 family metallopeptidase [Rhizomicrobium sp.]
MLLLALEGFAAATLILSVTHVAARQVKIASLRHLVRLGGMVALLLLPLFTAFFPSQFVLRMAPPVAVPGASSPPISTHAIGWLLPGMAALWLVGALALLARGLVGAYALKALSRRRQSHPFDPAKLASWSARAGLCSDWRLYLSTDVQTPISWGIFRPTVFLPEQCAAWTADQLDAAMLHELSHLRRRDGVAQAIALICCALYWPHPLVWAQARALRADAENAADDAVIVSGIKQSDYADLLLRVAAGVGQTRSFAGLEFSMAERSGLDARIQSILAPNPLRSGVTKMQILKTALFGTAAALVFALARPSFADMQPTPLQPAESPAANTLSRPVTQNELPALGDKAVKAKPAAGAGPVRHARRSRRTDVLSPADSAHIGEAVGNAVHEAHIGDIVAKAVNDAHIGEAVAKATSEAQISEKVSAALAEAHLSEKIAAAMKEVQPKIDAAVARAQRAAQAAEGAPPATQSAAPQ